MTTLTIEIFRTGRHQPMAGSAASFTEADLDSIVSAYDPSLHEAPVVLGHPNTDDPAYGWTKGLARDGDVLTAQIGELHPAFVEAWKNGSYKKRSASFYRPDSAINPKPGTYYLKHIGFLGAVPPAVKGLRDAQFAACTPDDLIEVEIDFAETNTQGASMKTKTKAFAEGDATTTPGDAPKTPSLEALWLVIASLLPADMPEPEKEAAKKKIEAALKGEEPAPVAPVSAEHAERERAITRRELEQRKRETEFATKQNVAFLEGLVSEGKPLPAKQAALLGIMSVLGGGELAEVSFGEGEEREPLDIFRDLLKNARSEIDFGERSEGGDDDDASDGANRDELTRAKDLSREVMAYQETEAKNGNIIDTAEAYEAVMKGKATK